MSQRCCGDIVPKIPSTVPNWVVPQDQLPNQFSPMIFTAQLYEEALEVKMAFGGN
jgi:hypothetical protein